MREEAFLECEGEVDEALFEDSRMRSGSIWEAQFVIQTIREARKEKNLIVENNSISFSS